MTEYEKQKNTIIDLQDRLADAELQIIEAEKLRKKMHNTILVTTLLCLTNISLNSCSAKPPLFRNLKEIFEYFVEFAHFYLILIRVVQMKMLFHIRHPLNILGVALT